MNAIFQFKSVSYSAPGEKPGENTGNIITDASFEIITGTFTVISGPSGSGKTTLLRLFNRLADPTSGEIQFDGKNIRDYPVKGLRKHIGWVPQVPVRFKGTVDDNLRLPFTISKPVKYEKEEIDKAIEELKSYQLLPPELYSRKADDLSVGEAQRLNLLRALALKPDVLLLDEPTSALDPEASDALLSHIERIQAEHNLTSIMVSHRPDEVKRVGDVILRISNGTVRVEVIRGVTVDG